MANLLQLRVLGEKEHFVYLKGDGIITKSIDAIFGTENAESFIERQINILRKSADVLGIHLSNALIYELQ